MTLDEQTKKWLYPLATALMGAILAFLLKPTEPGAVVTVPGPTQTVYRVDTIRITGERVKVPFTRVVEIVRHDTVIRTVERYVADPNVKERVYDTAVVPLQRSITLTTPERRAVVPFIDAMAIRHDLFDGTVEVEPADVTIAVPDTLLAQSAADSPSTWWDIIKYTIGAAAGVLTAWLLKPSGK